MPERAVFDKTKLVDQLLDGIATTTYSICYLKLVENAPFPKITEDIQESHNALRALINESTQECNKIIRLIGGIPVKFGLRTEFETPGTITQLTNFTNGAWVFDCQSPHERASFVGGATIERLKEIHQATLPPQ